MVSTPNSDTNSREHLLRRRRILTTGGIGLTTALAGCAGETDDSDDDTGVTNDTTDDTESDPPSDMDDGGDGGDDTGTATFEITVEHPDEVEVGETHELTITVRNTGDAAGEFEERLEISTLSTDEWDNADMVTLELDPGEREEVVYPELEFSEPWTVQFRLGDTRWQYDIADTKPEYDVTVEYSTEIQAGGTGTYDLPEQLYDGWEWLVIELVPTEGDLNMEDVWFRGFAETEERLYAVNHDSSDVSNGIESRGGLREGGTGIVLHSYPPSPKSEFMGWNTSIMDQSVNGENIISSDPGELYPPVSLEYSISTTSNPENLPAEYADRRGDNEVWAVVSVDVTEGYLNMEDVWFRSQLTTDSRRHELSHDSQHATRGVLSRGMVKPGNTAQALYTIGEGETIEEWGYTEDARQSVNVTRKD